MNAEHIGERLLGKSSRFAVAAQVLAQHPLQVGPPWTVNVAAIRARELGETLLGARAEPRVSGANSAHSRWRASRFVPWPLDLPTC